MDKNNGCNRFVVPKNIGIEYHFTMVAHVAIFDYYWLKIATAPNLGCGQNGSHDDLGVKIMVAIDLLGQKTYV